MRVLIAGAPTVARSTLRIALADAGDEVVTARTPGGALASARGTRLIVIADDFDDGAIDAELRRDHPGAVVVRGFSEAVVALAAALRHEGDGREAVEEAGRRSTFLAEASPLLDASLDLRATLDSIAEVSVPHLADICLVDVVDGPEVRRVASAAGDVQLERLLRGLPRRYQVDVAGDDPVARVVRNRRAEIVHGEVSRVFGGRTELGDHRPRSAMIVPLVARGRAIGVLALASVNADRAFTDAQLEHAGELAHRAALALDNALLYQHQSTLARVLQESLLPDRLPEFGGVDLGAAFRPAGDGAVIGGDFYDAIVGADDALTLMIGDVTGKGAGAAALTSLSRHTLRTAAMYEHGPSEILSALNRALLASRGRRGKYCTVALCRLERSDGGFTARVSCAGHPSPLLLRRDGEVREVGAPGTILGFVDDPDNPEVTTALEPGDAVVLYTDGITEARTRTGLLGDRRFAEMLHGCAGMSASAIAARLERAVVESQQGDTRDDVAITVARVTEPVSG
ncbi:MAG: Serine phosphatase RsbU, regulator of sigma subunit [uncultured Solirubrobacteraceae bacterium]|uniref:Serine phosphatase RsbU, regulator of sigma subunit n=1 Tax=uncultured Solirubrobacteraceae bacterium TaxID=1162706 RepID=A0A6J4STR7_9ACTN|nr:MAG: Serine phosphatase RsbU, regulator of sigma subunit [uncultured Solirubrobacteraceae bacterium]